MGYLEKYRIFVPELRRSLHIAKYRNEQKSARFHIVTYIIKANAQLLDFQSKSNLERVSFVNTISSERLLNFGPYHQAKFGGYKRMSYFCPRLPDSPATELFKH